MYIRIARALGWSVNEVQQFSLLSLRDMVRSVDSRLAREIDSSIRSGEYLKFR